MNDIELLALLSKSDSDIQRNGVAKARTLLGKSFPARLLSVYKKGKTYQTRMSCVYYSIPYCRWNADSLQLGIDATRDRSKFVRYRAFQLLAYSQNEVAEQHLREIYSAATNAGMDDEDLTACYLALTRRNFNCFLDRKCSGMIFPRWTEILPDGSRREIAESKPCLANTAT